MNFLLLAAQLSLFSSTRAVWFLISETRTGVCTGVARVMSAEPAKADTCPGTSSCAIPDAATMLSLATSCRNVTSADDVFDFKDKTYAAVYNFISNSCSGLPAKASATLADGTCVGVDNVFVKYDCSSGSPVQTVCTDDKCSKNCSTKTLSTLCTGNSHQSSQVKCVSKKSTPPPPKPESSSAVSSATRSATPTASPVRTSARVPSPTCTSGSPPGYPGGDHPPSYPGGSPHTSGKDYGSVDSYSEKGAADRAGINFSALIVAFCAIIGLNF